ncbi:hypothetical protein HPULCUR_007443 [Helicostylum pulchrum]|uniref:Uncharacterized protein n=1 Tax=Helicostylum pulchrum TaxID=562976 RepID=A0ABP9Y5X7_9FUNG
MNGNEYQQHPPPLRHQQQMNMGFAMPMISHLMPPHHPSHQPPNFFHPPPPPPPPPPMYSNDQTNGQYMDYGYHPNVPFMQPGYYSDITVFVPTLQKSFALNSNILKRSPILRQRIIEEQSSTLELDLYVLLETFQTIMGHLNHPLTPQDILFLASEKPQIAIELLEASEELGINDLLIAILAVLKQNLVHLKTAMIYVNAMEPYQPLEDEEPRHWVEALEEHVVSFMVRVLPAQLDAFSTSVKVSGNVLIGQISACGYMPSRTPPKQGLTSLARAYAALPQHLMIRCLEHPALPAQDAIQRSYFAKRVLSIVDSMNQQQHQQHQQQQQQHQQQPQQRQNIHSSSNNNNLMAVMKFEKGIETIAIVRQTGLKKGCWNPKLYGTI